MFGIKQVSLLEGASESQLVLSFKLRIPKPNELFKNAHCCRCFLPGVASVIQPVITLTQGQHIKRIPEA